MDSIDPLELKEKLTNSSAEQSPLLLDIRKPHEREICKIEGSIAIPLDDLRYHLQELDPKREIVIICHKGLRSMRAAVILETAGFKQIFNLSGGIDAWASLADPNMTKY